MPAQKRQAIPGIVTAYGALEAVIVTAAHGAVVETKTVVVTEVALPENGGAAVAHSMAGWSYQSVCQLLPSPTRPPYMLY